MSKSPVLILAIILGTTLMLLGLTVEETAACVIGLFIFAIASCKVMGDNWNEN